MPLDRQRIRVGAARGQVDIDGGAGKLILGEGAAVIGDGGHVQRDILPGEADIDGLRRVKMQAVRLPR